MLEMNKSLRDSIEKLKPGTAAADIERVNRIERRLIELNSSYDGVMKELLDQKSLIHEIAPRKPRREEIKQRPEPVIKQEVKPAPPEKPQPKN